MILHTDIDVLFLESPLPALTAAYAHGLLFHAATEETAKRGYRGLNTHLMLLRPSLDMHALITASAALGHFIPFTRTEQDVLESLLPLSLARGGGAVGLAVGPNPEAASAAEGQRRGGANSSHGEDGAYGGMVTKDGLRGPAGFATPSVDMPRHLHHFYSGCDRTAARDVLHPVQRRECTERASPSLYLNATSPSNTTRHTRHVNASKPLNASRREVSSTPGWVRFDRPGSMASRDVNDSQRMEAPTLPTPRRLQAAQLALGTQQSAQQSNGASHGARPQTAANESSVITVGYLSPFGVDAGPTQHARLSVGSLCGSAVELAERCDALLWRARRSVARRTRRRAGTADAFTRPIGSKSLAPLGGRRLSGGRGKRDKRWQRLHGSVNETAPLTLTALIAHFRSEFDRADGPGAERTGCVLPEDDDRDAWAFITSDARWI